MQKNGFTGRKGGFIEIEIAADLGDDTGAQCECREAHAECGGHIGLDTRVEQFGCPTHNPSENRRLRLRSKPVLKLLNSV